MEQLMTQEEIIEGNKQITKFLKYKFKNTKKYWCRYPLDDNSFLSKLGYVANDNLKFHSDWNWLMPVVRRIQQSAHGLTNNASEEEKFAYGIFGLSIVSPIDTVYMYVVNYVKWLNDLVDGKTFNVKDLLTGEIKQWTLERILEEINRDHSDKWTPYDETDWEEGWNEWVKEDGYYELIK